ncbi:MAG TPA: maleylacetoacetate isomerase [Anaeromyxobacteraceae bacterium]|nr:maleylacetoacetate isomerase [Anaeromyxobacteraceae bacterium]
MTLRLFSYWRSSSSWRVRIGLGLKGLAFEYAAVNLLAGEQFSEEHRARSPLGQVPVLEVEEDGRKVRLVQSIAILEWLDDRFPEPPLLPPDLLGRARVRALAEHVNSGIQPYQNTMVLKMVRALAPEKDREWARTFIALGLDGLERSTRDVAGRFSFGDAPGLADCYLVPQLYAARRFGVDLAAYPTLRRVEEACQALAAFQAAHPDRQPDAPPLERRTP